MTGTFLARVEFPYSEEGDYLLRVYTDGFTKDYRNVLASPPNISAGVKIPNGTWVYAVAVDDEWSFLAP